MFGDYKLGVVNSGVFVVIILAVKKRNNVGILFERARVA
jgi:hypothetical protein